MNTPIGKARDVIVEVKAAYLTGLYAGLSVEPYANQELLDAMRPHAITAAQVAFGDGAFSPVALWKMVEYYDAWVDRMEGNS